MQDRPDLARYFTLNYRPYPNRSEHASYGIVVLMPQGGAQVHIANSLRKVRALFPAADIAALRNSGSAITKAVAGMPPAQALSTLQFLRVADFDGPIGHLGQFTFRGDASYKSQVRSILAAECEPQSTQSTLRESKSRLYTDIKSHFRRLNLLGDDIDHAVVAGFVPDASADLSVDFALRNGALSLAQSVDLRSSAGESIDTPHRHQLLSKTLAMDYTRRVMPDASSDSVIIVAGGLTAQGERILAPARTYDARIIHWEHAADVEGFFGTWADRAGKPMVSLPFGS